MVVPDSIYSKRFVSNNLTEQSDTPLPPRPITMPETRIIRENGGMYAVQEKRPFLKIFHRWRTIYETRQYYDALLFKTTYIPKDVFEIHIKKTYNR